MVSHRQPRTKKSIWLRACFLKPDAFIISYPGELQESLELLGKGCLRGCANVLIYQLATLEEEDGRDITNTKLHSDVVVLLYITLAYYQLAVKLLSKF